MGRITLKGIQNTITNLVNKAGNFRGIPSRIRAIQERRIRPEFEAIKQEMIEDFLDHPVTREIQAGPRLGGNNPSGLLGGYGELFSFIGFNAGSDPIKPILEKLNKIQLVHVKTTVQSSKYRVDIPTPREIFDVTPYPWVEGRKSWAEGIETGISGLGYYLNPSRKRKGRSTAGIQLHLPIRSAKFQTTLYITDLLNRYREKFKALEL